jgi:peptidoglycan/LPS O-acetylase OafA/YrhL
MVLGVTASRNVITNILALPALAFLGEISYSLYILQQPVYTLYTRYILYNGNFVPDRDFYIYTVMLIAIASVSYLFFEKPCKTAILRFNARLDGLRSEKMR